MKCYSALGFLGIIISIGASTVYAMENQACRPDIRKKRYAVQMLWKMLDNPSEIQQEHLSSIDLNHIEFVRAVLSKLEEMKYPTLPTDQRSLLNTTELTLLDEYCRAQVNEKVFRHQDLNKCDRNHAQFRQSCITYFQLVGNHDTIPQQ